MKNDPRIQTIRHLLDLVDVRHWEARYGIGHTVGASIWDRGRKIAEIPNHLTPGGKFQHNNTAHLIVEAVKLVAEHFSPTGKDVTDADR